MNQTHINSIAGKLSISTKQVAGAMQLLQEGATIPFISRYRKEATGSLDEVQIGNIDELSKKLIELDKRRESILDSIEKQGKLTDELKAAINKANELNELEDIYLPYKLKRKTRAVIAMEKGLEPLAKLIMAQQSFSVEERALKFVNEKVESVEEALQGARDIIAEWVNENQTARNIVRNFYDREAIVRSKVVKAKEEEAVKYTDYFDSEEALAKCPSHRLLAMRRGEAEGFLKISVEPEQQKAIDGLVRFFVKSKTEAATHVEKAVTDSYKRLLQPSIETEYSSLSKEKADLDAIRVFAENLKQLLMLPPLGEKRVLAIDPGYRTGCKVVCLDAQGNLVHNETIYPHQPQGETKQASHKIASLVNAYKIEAIAIGNGTASRETEHFIRNVKFDRDVKVFVISEAGASIYSASPLAREEFPQFDVTVRGAISIGRRLIDPLAELVKIDPKSIGVGQYQHDVDQGRLKQSLDRTVESCVNSVGVDVNTASKQLLTYVSGLGPQLAQNIVDFRKENGGFTSRKKLKKVPRMGEKSFEQSAGFLRIRNGENPLDNSAVHPESYHLVEKMASELLCTVDDLLKNETHRKQIDINKYVSHEIGLPTLTDILSELEKPGRDPRSKVKMFEFSKDVYKMDDLREGMILPGIISNITNFGAFVDIGVKQDGLVHISQLKDGFVSNPLDVVSLNQHVKVKVIQIDISRKRIQLSMKDINQS